MVSESRVGNHQGNLTDVSEDKNLPTDTGDLPEQNYGLSPSPLKFTPHVTPFYELGFPEPPCELMEDRAGVITVDTISSSEGAPPQERVLFTRRAARILKKRERRNIDTQVPSDDPDQCYKGSTTERQRRLIITGFVPEERRIIDQNLSPLAGENGEQVTWDAVITSYTRAVNSIFIRGRFSPEEADQYTQEFFIKNNKQN